uniref:Uncharacterized protein n=1 Tax=Bigelowiella natans TaxID=227086 RepID=A0A7S2KHB0_BIGNA|mmetsp:Transcript_1278/g.1938  ORF Transcript_1278/g.1938 Transcript_1278/m.1938 type:complete len:285 (+) Transcript_1278:166-1020(+)
MMDAAQPFLAGASSDSKNEAKIVGGEDLLAMMNRLEHPCLHFFDKRGWGKVRILFSIIFPASSALFAATFFVDFKFLQYLNAFWLLLVSFTSLVFSWNLYSDYRKVIAVKTIFFQTFELRDVHAQTRDGTNVLKEKIKNLQKLKDHLIDVLSKMEKYKTSLASNVESISEVQKRTSDQLKEGVLLSERVEDYFREKMDSAIKNLKNTSRASVEERLRFINILLDEVGGGMITEYVLFVFLANDMNEDHIRLYNQYGREEFNRFMKMMHKHEVGQDLFRAREDFC